MRHFLLALVAAVAAGFVVVTPASAHCDGMDGPVVQAAQRALAEGSVTPVLKWVRPRDEAEIRATFDHAMSVRAVNAEARELADRWFFETLVRIHREGEGAPYTGLKPAGAVVDEGIEAADVALASGDVGALVGDLGAHVQAAVRERFERTHALRAHADESVAAGRDYVHAYVDYIHFVEALQALLAHGAGDHAPAATQAH